MPENAKKTEAAAIRQVDFQFIATPSSQSVVERKGSMRRYSPISRRGFSIKGMMRSLCLLNSNIFVPLVNVVTRNKACLNRCSRIAGDGKTVWTAADALQKY